jgi:hypothetical protein
MRHLVLALPLIVGCATEETFEGGDLEDVADAGWDAKADGARIAVTASSVEALNRNLSSLTPPCRTADPGHTCELYLSPASALGDFGPIGAYGPLGSLGPLGSNAWNTSYWISAAGDWSDQSDRIDGPLGATGPLGASGPLGDRAYYETLPSINDWAKQLQGGGVWTVLGPLGPLGALGPLGPLGPIGAHGYEPDDGGRFMNGSRTVRTIKTTYQAEAFELVEMYDEDTARSVSPDTSFVALGEVPRGSVDVFPAKSLRDQFVTVLVVPEKQLDNFDLTIKDATGRVIAQSKSSSYIDWIQLQAPKGGSMKIEVSLAASGHFLSKTYRLYVVGSGSKFNATDIRGAHQLSL